MDQLSAWRQEKVEEAAIERRKAFAWLAYGAAGTFGVSTYLVASRLIVESKGGEAGGFGLALLLCVAPVVIASLIGYLACAHNARLAAHYLSSGVRTRTGYLTRAVRVTQQHDAPDVRATFWAVHLDEAEHLAGRPDLYISVPAFNPSGNGPYLVEAVTDEDVTNAGQPFFSVYVPPRLLHCSTVVRGLDNTGGSLWDRQPFDPDAEPGRVHFAAAEPGVPLRPSGRRWLVYKAVAVALLLLGLVLAATVGGSLTVVAAILAGLVAPVGGVLPPPAEKLDD